MSVRLASHRSVARRAAAGGHGAGPSSLLFGLCALTLTANLILGGGTRSGFLSDAVLQFIALPLLLTALWRLWEANFDSHGQWALRFCLVAVLAPLLQLIPLPPSIWTSLPHRERLIETFELIGAGLPWAPISVSPHATWLASLSALPPLALFLGVAMLDQRERRRLTLVLLALGGAAVFLGLLQIAQGPESGLRFFEFTNQTEAVGFFANRNHFAALLYALTPFAAAWAIYATRRRDPARHDPAGGGTIFQPPPAVALAVSFSLLAALVAAQAMARSRAGLGLTALAILGSFALAAAGPRRESRKTALRFLALSIAVAMTLVVQFAVYRMLDRFGADPLADARISFARHTIEAAWAFTPFGSGMGSFVSVYGLFDDAQDVLSVYANRAHNDVLEYWLEMGLAGVALMGAFAAWLVMRASAVWKRPAHGWRRIDIALSRAAALTAGLLVLHSLVDYPLRTSAMMSVMALACALLVEPPLRQSRTGDAGRTYWNR